MFFFDSKAYPESSENDTESSNPSLNAQDHARDSAEGPPVEISVAGSQAAHDADDAPHVADLRSRGWR